MRKILASATIAVLTAVILVRSGALPYLFSASYLPHRYCYLAQPWLVWLNVTMDGLIAASYVIIFACLFWIAHQLRRAPEIQEYLWVFAAFGIFIVACASTHMMEVVTIWWPIYRLSVAFKVSCAAASVTTAALFFVAAPQLSQSILHFIDTLSLSRQQNVADASERLRIEAQVRTSEARLQAVFNSVLDGIITMDAQGRILSTNAAMKSVFGYEAAELDAQNVTVLMAEPGDFSPTNLQTTTGIGKREGRTKTGRVFPMEMTITALMLDGQNYFVGVLRDITERKWAEASLREKEHFLSESQRIAHVGSWTWDLQDPAKTLTWSEELYRLYGVTAQTFTPTMDSFLARLLPEDQPGMQQWIAACAAGEKPGDLEFRVVMPNGTVKLCSRRGELQYDADNRPLRVAGTTQDISQRRADELEIQKLNEELEARIVQRTAQLESANYELEAFTYSVSHDLRAPLRHIAGFSRILVQDFGPGMVPEAREYLQRIGHAVHRMGQLVDGLLSLAKLGKQSLEVQPTDLNAVVEEALVILQPECEGRTVHWRIGALPTVACDRILMAQVFQNLLGNALKYSRDRAAALIEVDTIQEPGKPVIVFVRDNGAGFDMKYAVRLFGVFQRMHTQAEFEGTGVGLATVQRIVQKHGGNVWAEAEPNRGATFFFTLNAEQDATTATRLSVLQTGE